MISVTFLKPPQTLHWSEPSQWKQLAKLAPIDIDQGFQFEVKLCNTVALFYLSRYPPGIWLFSLGRTRYYLANTAFPMKL